MGKPPAAGAVPPEETRKMLADAGLMDDIGAVMGRSTDLLVKHGILVHEPAGLRPDPRFVDAWEAACARTGALHSSLAWAVRGWTGGAVDGPAAAAMCAAVIGMLGGTEIGRRLDAELSEWGAGASITHEAVRVEMRRARAGLESERL